MNSWEKSKGRQVHYIRVDAYRVTVGSHAGSGHTDYGTTCTHEAFLGGELHEHILRDHGPATLKQVLAAVKAAPANKEFQRRHKRTNSELEAWAQIPEEPGLAALAADPDDDGMRHYNGKNAIGFWHRDLFWEDWRQSIRVTNRAGEVVFEVPPMDNPLSLSNSFRIGRVRRKGDVILYRADNYFMTDVPEVMALLGKRTWLRVTEDGIQGRDRER